MKEESQTDALTGTVKGPGERPHEYLFITADNARARIGEFVYYTARDGRRSGASSATSPSADSCATSPTRSSQTRRRRPSVVSSLIGLDGEGCELYEITVETIGYFHPALGRLRQPAHPAAAGRPGLPRLVRDALAACLSPAARGRGRARRTSGAS